MTIQLWISNSGIVSAKPPDEDGWHLVAEERSSGRGYYTVSIPGENPKYEFYLLILLFPDRYIPKGVGKTEGWKTGSDWVVYSLPLPQGGIDAIDFLLTDRYHPVADFSAGPTSGTGSLTVHFTDLSLNNPVLWQWDFNDDDKIDSYDQHPTYTYTDSGTYTVRLVVSNSAGESMETKQDYIQVRQSSLPYTFILIVLLIGGLVSHRMWKDHNHRKKCRQSTEHIGSPGIEIRGGIERAADGNLEIPRVRIEITGGIEEKSVIIGR